GVLLGHLAAGLELAEERLGGRLQVHGSVAIGGHDRAYLCCDWRVVGSAQADHDNGLASCDKVGGKLLLGGALCQVKRSQHHDVGLMCGCHRITHCRTGGCRCESLYGFQEAAGHLVVDDI